MINNGASMDGRRSTATVDAVVVGGGLLGAASTYEMARAGLRTVLLERGAVNRESSGTTAGNIHIQGIHTRRPGQEYPADNSVFLPFQLVASAHWDTLEDELDTSLELRREGGFMVAETPEQAEELRHKQAMEERVGIVSSFLSGDEARREFPLLSDSVLAAIYCPGDGYANPLLVTPAYLRAAQRHGAEIHTFSPVVQIEPELDGFCVATREQRWATRVVVIASGAWSGQLVAMAGFDLGMTPVAIQMHATVRTEARMRHLVQHIGEGLSVKQVAAGNILIGGGWPASELTLEGRNTVSLTSMLGNLAQARRVLPFLGNLRVLRTWAGPLAATRDELPVVGEIPGMPGFLVASGTYGFTLAPLWARVIKDLAIGAPPEVDISPVAPNRLVRIGQETSTGRRPL